MAILETKNLSHKFVTEDGDIPVLSDIDLSVEEGELLAIIGPSGCGKSTLLRIMSGLIQAQKGEVILNNQILKSTTPKISFIFQNFAIFPWLTVEQNIAFPLKMMNQNANEIKQKVEETLIEVGLKGFEKSHPKQLSGGMKQRVGIGRALITDAPVILADEPFSALDAFTADELRDDLLRIWRKYHKTVVIVTHLVEEAVYLAGRIVIFTPRPGKIEKIISNSLPRPRNRRSDEFYKLSDHLTKVIRP